MTQAIGNNTPKTRQASAGLLFKVITIGILAFWYFILLGLTIGALQYAPIGIMAAGALCIGGIYFMRKRWGRPVSRLGMAVVFALLFSFGVAVVNKASEGSAVYQAYQRKTDQLMAQQAMADRQERIASGNATAEDLAALPPEQRLVAIVRNTLKDKVRTVEVKADPSGKRYVVFVAYNAEETFNTESMKFSVRHTMTKVMLNIYRLGLPINRIKIVAWGPTEDAYGNSSEGVLYHATLDGEEGDKINWQMEGEAAALMDVLPRHWEAAGILDK